MRRPSFTVIKRQYSTQRIGCCSGVGTGCVFVLELRCAALRCGCDCGSGSPTDEDCETGGARHETRLLCAGSGTGSGTGSCRSGAVPPATLRQGPLYGVHVCVSLAPNRASRAAAQQAAQAQDSLLHPALHLVGAVGYCCHGSIQ